MRQRLDALNELNRSDSVLTITERDEAQTLTDYFDSHGTPNDQLLANTEIPEDANAPGLQEARQKLLFAKMSRDEQIAYRRYIDDRVILADQIVTALSIVRPFLTHLNF
ncbi:MAG: hypothetical protein K6G32_06185 [Prevotella sp.]|nr:hypothetical protein [Prevotella sp.]